MKNNHPVTYFHFKEQQFIKLFLLVLLFPSVKNVYSFLDIEFITKKI